MSRKYPIVGSFKFAISGLSEALVKEPNFQVHTIIAVTSIIVAAILEFSKLEWVVLLFTIAFVLILELVNTAIENIVDIVSPEIQPQAKAAKDVAAASVLLSAIVAIFVGVTLFLPKVITLVQLSATTATPTIQQ